MNGSNEERPARGIDGPSAAEMRRRLEAELSLPSRLGHTALLLAGLAVAAVSGALLAGEVGLPGSTRVALAAIVGVGLAWAAFAAWVLARRRVLFASHRVVAARMAVAFTALFTLGTLALGQWGGTGRTWFAAGGMGMLMLAVAIVLLVRARRRFRKLSRRRTELEHLLTPAEGGS